MPGHTDQVIPLFHYSGTPLHGKYVLQMHEQIFGKHFIYNLGYKYVMYITRNSLA